MPTSPPKPDPAKTPAPPADETPETARERQEHQLDEALAESFPASDPVAIDPAP